MVKCPECGSHSFMVLNRDKELNIRVCECQECNKTRKEKLVNGEWVIKKDQRTLSDF